MTFIFSFYKNTPYAGVLSVTLFNVFFDLSQIIVFYLRRRILLTQESCYLWFSNIHTSSRKGKGFAILSQTDLASTSVQIFAVLLHSHSLRDFAMLVCVVLPMNVTGCYLRRESAITNGKLFYCKVSIF